MCAYTERYSIIDRTGAQTMLYLTCTTITIIGVSRAKDWVYVFVDCGTKVYLNRVFKTVPITRFFTSSYIRALLYRVNLMLTKSPLQKLIVYSSQVPL